MAEQPDFEFDLFISYADADKSWLDEHLLPRIHLPSERIFTKEKFQIGAPRETEIQRGVISSRFTLLVISKAYMGDVWATYGGNLATSLSVKEQEVRLIPLLLEDCSVPPGIEYLVYLDFTTEANWEQGFARLQKEFEPFAGNHEEYFIEIPLIIVAMTNEQARYLAEGKVFEDPAVAEIERSLIRQFLSSLQKHGVTDLPAHYGEEREDWRIFTSRQIKIRKGIENIVERINQKRKNASDEPDIPLIRPHFLSAKFFGEDRARVWKQLQQSGCILIVDAVSLFHPDVYETLRSSELCSDKERIIMLVLSPVSYSKIPTNELIEKHVEDKLERAFARFDQDLDGLCEIGVGDLRAFRRWLYANLPAAEDIVRRQKLDQSKKSMREKMATDPMGIDRAIFEKR